MSSGSEGGGMRVIADRGACCGYGICAEICPEIYKLDAAGIVVVEDESVPAELLERAMEGAEACPQMALKLEPIDG